MYSKFMLTTKSQLLSTPSHLCILIFKNTRKNQEMIKKRKINQVMSPEENTIILINNICKYMYVLCTC